MNYKLFRIFAPKIDNEDEQKEDLLLAAQRKEQQFEVFHKGLPAGVYPQDFRPTQSGTQTENSPAAPRLELYHGASKLLL